MNFQTYSLAMKACAPLAAIRAAWLRAGAAPAFAARRRNRPQPVWIHAADAAEVHAAHALARRLLGMDNPVLLTHATRAAMRAGARLFDEEIRRGRVGQAWLPHDTLPAWTAFFDRFQPRAAILMTHGPRPCLARVAQACGVPLVLANARVPVSAPWLDVVPAGLQRDAYRRLHAVHACTAADAYALIEAGASWVRVSGRTDQPGAIAIDMALEAIGGAPPPPAPVRPARPAGALLRPLRA